MVQLRTKVSSNQPRSSITWIRPSAMLIETQEGFDYTGADCRTWLADAGFRHSYVEQLVGPDSMVVGIK